MGRCCAWCMKRKSKRHQGQAAHLSSGSSLGAGSGLPLAARQAAELAAAFMASGVGWGSLCAKATRRSATPNCSRVSPLPSAGRAAFTLFHICKAWTCREACLL